MSDLEKARVAWRSYHDWVLPHRAVQIILATSLLFLFLGLLLLAIGGAVNIGGLIAAGSVLAGIGGCGLMVCLLLCLHAYFIFNVRDEAVQTTDNPWSEEVLPHDIAGYASINKPSALKSADSTLRRNGGAGKKVTMAPDVALDADVRAPALRTTAGSGDAAFVQASPHLYLASPASPGYRTLGSYAIVDTTGADGGGRGGGIGGGGGVRTSSGDSAMESFDQRSFAQQQQFQTTAQLQMALQQQQQALQRQQEDLDIQQQRQKLEYHRQQLLQQQQQQQQHQQHQQHQQQQHHFRVQQQPQAQSVTYAQIQRYPVHGAVVQHSPSPSLSSQQSSVFTTGSVSGGTLGGAGGAMVGGGGSQQQQASFNNSTSSGSGAYRIQTAGLQYQSGRPYPEDDDYDNPAERTPMLPPSSSSTHVAVAERLQHQQQSSPASFSYSAGGGGAGESLRAGGSISGSQYSIHRQQGSAVGGGGGATSIPIQHAGSSVSSSSLVASRQAGGVSSGNQRVVTATASSASPFPHQQPEGQVGGQRYTSSFSTRVYTGSSGPAPFPSSSSSSSFTQQPLEQSPPFFLADGRSSSASTTHQQHHHQQQQHQQQQQHYQQSSSRSSSFASSIGGGGAAAVTGGGGAGGGGGGGKGVTFSSGVKGGGVEDEVEGAELPEPMPLQHPSERRPMTFEQQSSSKMSIYDNVLFPYAEAEGE